VNDKTPKQDLRTVYPDLAPKPGEAPPREHRAPRSPRPMNIVPEIGKHGLAVGKNGSGKTTTVASLIVPASQVYPVLVIDSKGDGSLEQLPGARVVTLPKDIEFDGLEIYKPEGLLNTSDYLDGVLQLAYETKRSMYVYIDEMYQVCSRPQPSLGLSNLLMRGRHRSVNGRPVRMSTLMSSQRPSWIPRHCGTEATYFYVHDLALPDDRKRMAELTGMPSLAMQPGPNHEFWFYKTGMGEPILCRINKRKELT